MVRSFAEFHPETYGFDAVAQFPPHCQATPVTPLVHGASDDFRGHIYDYTALRQQFIEELRTIPEDLTLYAGVMPSWDNTARRGDKSSIWVNSSPEAYFEWLSDAAGLVRKRHDPNNQLIFINAWNEWAEGCHLEPDQKFGYAWLNATSLALQQTPPDPAKTAGAVLNPEPPVIEPIQLSPLAKIPKLVISVLFYHREDIIPLFLRSLLPQMKEVIADLLLAQPVGWGVEVLGELPDGAEVGLLGVFAESGQLKVLDHPLA